MHLVRVSSMIQMSRVRDARSAYAIAMANQRRNLRILLRISLINPYNNSRLISNIFQENSSKSLSAVARE